MKTAEYYKRYNIIDMGLGFSAMIRNFVDGTKEKLHKKIMKDIDKIFSASNKDEFNAIHKAFCKWGVGNIMLAERKDKKGNIIKKSSPASYGQIAKTLDVVMKVSIYYSHLPNSVTSKKLRPLLNAAVDNQMMRMLKKDYKSEMLVWPKTVGEVDEEKYKKLQNIVCQFIIDKHNDQIIPVQFDDIYWKRLNR